MTFVVPRIFAVSCDLLRRKIVDKHVLTSLVRHHHLSRISNNLNRLPVQCQLVPRAMKHTGSKFSRGKDGNKGKVEEDEDDEDSNNISSVSIVCNIYKTHGNLSN